MVGCGGKWDGLGWEVGGGRWEKGDLVNKVKARPSMIIIIMITSL